MRPVPNRRGRYAGTPQQAVVPSQIAPLARSNDPYIEADIAADAARETRPRRLLDYLPQPKRTNVYPGNVHLVDFSGEAEQGVMLLVIPRNANRKRFLIINPDTAPGTLYFSFGNNRASLIPLVPGEVWNEADTTVARNDIFITSNLINHKFGAFEGEAVDDGIEDEDD